MTLMTLTRDHFGHKSKKCKSSEAVILQKFFFSFYKTTTRLQHQVDYKSQPSTTLNRHCSSEFGYKTIHTSYIINNIKISKEQMQNSKLYIANFKEK